METFVLAAVAAAAMGFGFYLVISALQSRGEARARDTALFLVSSANEDATAQVEVAEKLLRALIACRKVFTLEAVVPHVGDKIHFYIAVSRKVEARVARELRRLFGQYAVERVHDDHIVFSPHGAVAGAMVLQKESPVLPIPVYREIGADLLKDVLRGLAEVCQIGEGAAVQFVVRPANSAVHPLMRKGVPAEPLVAVNARVLASAGSEFRAKDILDGIVSGFEKFKGPHRNALRAAKLRAPHPLVRQFLERTFDRKHAMLLTRQELASLYHIGQVSRAEDAYPVVPASSSYSSLHSFYSLS